VGWVHLGHVAAPEARLPDVLARLIFAFQLLIVVGGIGYAIWRFWPG
jgi:hypothetical protein